MSWQSLRDRLIRTFERKSVNRIVFSPRIYYWYLGNNLLTKRNVEKHLKGPVPEKYWAKSQLEIYDMLDANPRYSEE